MKKTNVEETKTVTEQVEMTEENEKARKKTEPHGRQLNIDAMFSVLRQQKKGERLKATELQEELGAYGFELEKSNVVRGIGSICYTLLTFSNNKQNGKDMNDLFPFFIHAVIDFENNAKVEVKTIGKAEKEKMDLEEHFYNIFKLCVKEIKGKKVKELTKEDKEKIRKKVDEYFPITLSDDGTRIKKMDLHFPLHYKDPNEETESLIESQMPSDVNLAPEYIDFLGVFLKANGKSYGYYFPNDTEYYIEEERLNEQELKMIMDAIEVYSYISKEDTAKIMRKLAKINSPVQHHFYGNDNYPDKVEKLNPNNSKTFFDNLKDIEECIENKQRMWIQYGEYQYVKTDKGKRKIDLQIKQNYQVQDENGKMINKSKLVSPYHVMWANGYYYVIVSFEGKSNLVSLRIDRILDVVKAEENGNKVEIEPFPEEYYVTKIEGTDKVSSQKFMNMAVVMHADKPEKVIFRCRKYLLNNVIDGFGFDIKVEIPSDEKGNEWLEVTSEHASISGTTLWLTQHCADSYAVEPQELKDKVEQNLRRGSAYYY